jgi:hypothetical protein
MRRRRVWRRRDDHARRRRRRLHSIVAAAASMFFVPHSGKVVVRKPTSGEPPRHGLSASSLEPVVTVSTEYRLPAEVEYQALIQEAASHYGVDAALVRAVMRMESAFDQFAISPAGALGLMQLMPALALELGVKDPFDPRENIFAGVKYLRALLDEHNGSEPLALASYNAGPGTVAHYAGIPPYPETQHYVRTITGMLARERRAVAAADEPAPLPQPE